MLRSSVHTPAFSRTINVSLALPAFMSWQYAIAQLLFLSVLLLSNFTWPVILTLTILSIGVSIYGYFLDRKRYSGVLLFSPSTGWRIKRGDEIETLVLYKAQFVGNSFLKLVFNNQSRSFFSRRANFILAKKQLGIPVFKQLKALIVTGQCS